MAGEMSSRTTRYVVRRGFNEARAQWPGKFACRRPSERDAASMRPEHNGRGNPPTGCRPARNGFNEARAQWPGKSFAGQIRRGLVDSAASMRPQHNGRGNLSGG